MSQTFQCPNCGAPVDLDASADPVIPCPYCQSAIIVPEALRARPPEANREPISASIQGSSGAFFTDMAGDFFQLENLGRLKEMADLAKGSSAPLVVSADSLDGLAELTDQIKSAGVEDMVLDPQMANLPNALATLTQRRGDCNEHAEVIPLGET